MRPTIALCLIVKNEEKNLPVLLESVKDCFDEIHVTDTGSTDKTREILTQMHHQGDYGTQIFQHYFTWCDDFAAARNFSFEPAKTDYVMWLDADDSLADPKAFREWRDNVMNISDFWVATYHYALNPQGQPVCSFSRERVIKRTLGLKWKYFVHEGIPGVRPDGKPITAAYATTWAVIHRRSEEDIKVDRSRNLKLFQKRVNELDPRMQYYYGKELFENNQPSEALDWLLKACKEIKMEPHDAILARQYGAMAAQLINQYDRAIQIAHNGLMLSPARAEFFILIGDCYLKKNDLAASVPYYQAARHCSKAPDSSLMQPPIFQHGDSYTIYPRNQLIRVYFHLGDVKKAKELLLETKLLYPNPETDALETEINKTIAQLPISTVSGALQRSDDILISCHPSGFYEWDEEIAKERGIGGSEIAVVKMARELHKKTGRKVLIYNNRSESKVIDGVEYHPAQTLGSYTGKYLPAVHVAWRHNLKVTEAPTYLWCHDLFCPGIENHENYEKVLALSEFHRSYIHNLFRVPKEKISITRNGIDPSRFEKLTFQKILGKVVWSSSPDRGLDRAIAVMDQVVQEIPEAALHVYYGFDNMLKMGKQSEVKALESLINDRPWIHYHGNIEQRQLAEEFSSAVVWLYPTNFLETFCITALEMLLCRVFPVVRNWGGLADTLRDAEARGMAFYLDDCETALQITRYADAVINAIQGDNWQIIDVTPPSLSWESVATEWVELLGLSR